MCIVTGGYWSKGGKITTDIGEMVSLVKQVNGIPCAVGFGVSNTDQASEIAQKADGVIVGSAIVKLVERYGRDCLGPVRDFVSEMKAAVIE